MVAAEKQLAHSNHLLCGTDQCGQGLRGNPGVSGGITDYRGRVHAPQVRRHATRAGGQFEAENDADEAAKARGNPFHRQRGSPKRNRCGQRGQQHANDSYEDHGGGRTKAKFFELKALVVDRRGPMLQVARDACSLDGSASLKTRHLSQLGF